MSSEPTRKKPRSNNSPQPQDSNIIEILSEEEEPQVIDITEEEEEPSNQDIQITGVNPNPTPLRPQTLFINHQEGNIQPANIHNSNNLNDNNDNDDEVEITDVRHVPTVEVHTPIGNFRVINHHNQQQQQRLPTTPTIFHNPNNRHPLIPVRPPLARTRSTNSARRITNPRHRRNLIRRQPSITGLGAQDYMSFIAQYGGFPSGSRADLMGYILDSLSGGGGGGNHPAVVMGGGFDPRFEQFPNQANNTNDMIDQSILQRIEHENERELNQRLARENQFNQKTMLEKQEIAKREHDSHTNTINPETSLVCELCSIELGEGIPEEFKCDWRYNDNFEKFAKLYQVPAPWFCVNPITKVDQELSTRIFVAKCGHAFCGRCVKNIGNRPRRTKATPLGFTILNPAVYAPSKCPAIDCGRKFSSKSFIELYF